MPEPIQIEIGSTQEVLINISNSSIEVALHSIDNKNSAPLGNN